MKSEETSRRNLIPWARFGQFDCQHALPEYQLNPDRKAVAKTKRRIEITVERHRRIVLSQRNQPMTAWCEACCAHVRMVTPDEAAQLCNVSTRTIYRRIETDRLHFTETDRGFSLVCLQSVQDNGNSTPGWSEETSTRRSPGLFGKNLMKRVLKRR